MSTKFCLLETFSHWKSEEVTSSSCTFFSVKAKGRRQFMPSLNIADCFPRNFVCTFSSETGQLCPRSASLYWAALGWAGLGWAGGYQVRGGRLVCVPALSCSAPAAASRTLSLAQATAPHSSHSRAPVTGHQHEGCVAAGEIMGKKVQFCGPGVCRNL